MRSLRLRLLFAALMLTVGAAMLVTHSDAVALGFAFASCLPLLESWRRRGAAD